MGCFLALIRQSDRLVERKRSFGYEVSIGTGGNKKRPLRSGDATNFRFGKLIALYYADRTEWRACERSCGRCVPVNGNAQPAKFSIVKGPLMGSIDIRAMAF